MAKKVETSSFTVKKELVSEKAEKMIEQFQAEFEAKTGGKISKPAAVIKLIERYADITLKM
jgi:hypothetical protein